MIARHCCSTVFLTSLVRANGSNTVVMVRVMHIVVTWTSQDFVADGCGVVHVYMLQKHMLCMCMYDDDDDDAADADDADADDDDDDDDDEVTTEDHGQVKLLIAIHSFRYAPVGP
eukprot:672487-Amphidinium_carterae.2